MPDLGPVSANSEARNLFSLNATKVASWREAHHLQDDADFAYRWTSHAQAVAEGGHLLAHAWLQVRASQEQQLLPAAARMVEAMPRPRPVPSSAPPPRVPKKIKWTKRRQGVRLRSNLADDPEVIQQRVASLARTLQVLGAIRPAGVMSHRLHDEWSESVLRLAQRLVTQSEAPSRALASLKWLNTNGQLQSEVTDLTTPVSTNTRRKKGEAPVITPPMLPFLEEQAEALCLAGDERWTCLLASWVIATGCLRHRHLVRTSPRRISLSTFHGFCSKGKQRHVR